MKIILTVISILLLSAGCVSTPHINAGNPVMTGKALNGYGWQIMSPDQKNIYVRGYFEGLAAGSVVIIKYLLPEQEKVLETFANDFKNHSGRLKGLDTADWLTKYYRRAPMSKVDPVSFVLGWMILEALKHEK